jgi:hypothetical protein
MKKLGLFAMAIAMITLVGCNKTPKPDDPTTDVTAVTISETSIELTIGGTKNLKATTEPAGGKITWESANAEVATVTSAGLVTGVAEGQTTITAKSGDKTATCSVKVSNDVRYDQFNVVDYGLFGTSTMIEGTDTVFSLRGGTLEATCQLGTISDVYAWDGSANFVSGTGFVGDGYVYHFENLPVWWITECAGDPSIVGYYIGAGGFSSYPQEDPDAVEPYNCKPGQIDQASYFTFVKAQYGDDEADFDAMMEKTWGSMIGENYNDRLYLDYGLYSGHINRFLYLDEDEEEGIDAMWAADVDWASMDADRLWGYRWDTTYYMETYVEGEGGEIRFIEPYDYAVVNRLFDANGLWTGGDEEEAPLRMAAKKNDMQLGNMSKLHKGVKFEGRKQVIR